MPRRAEPSEAASSGTSRYNLRNRDVPPSPQPSLPPTPRTRRTSTRPPSASASASSPATPARRRRPSSRTANHTTPRSSRKLRSAVTTTITTTTSPTALEHVPPRPPSARRRRRPLSAAAQSSPVPGNPESAVTPRRAGQHSPSQPGDRQVDAPRAPARRASALRKHLHSHPPRDDPSPKTPNTRRVRQRAQSPDEGEEQPPEDKGMDLHDEHDDVEDINNWRKYQLVMECKRRHLPSTGTKKELKERITASISQPPGPSNSLQHHPQLQDAPIQESRATLTNKQEQRGNAKDSAEGLPQLNTSLQRKSASHRVAVTFIPPILNDNASGKKQENNNEEHRETHSTRSGEYVEDSQSLKNKGEKQGHVGSPEKDVNTNHPKPERPTGDGLLSQPHNRDAGSPSSLGKGHSLSRPYVREESPRNTGTEHGSEKSKEQEADEKDHVWKHELISDTYDSARQEWKGHDASTHTHDSGRSHMQNCEEEDRLTPSTSERQPANLSFPVSLHSEKLKSDEKQISQVFSKTQGLDEQNGEGSNVILSGDIPGNTTRNQKQNNDLFQARIQLSRNNNCDVPAMQSAKTDNFKGYWFCSGSSAGAGAIADDQTPPHRRMTESTIEGAIEPVQEIRSSSIGIGETIELAANVQKVPAEMKIVNAAGTELARVQIAGRSNNSSFSESPLPSPRSMIGDKQEMPVASDTASLHLQNTGKSVEVAKGIAIGISALDRSTEAVASPPHTPKMDGSTALARTNSEQVHNTSYSEEVQPSHEEASISNREPEQVQDFTPFTPHEFGPVSERLPQDRDETNSDEEQGAFGNEGIFNNEQVPQGIGHVSVAECSSADELLSEDNDLAGANEDSDGPGDPVDEAIEGIASRSDSPEDAHSGDSRYSSASLPQAGSGDQLSPRGSYSSARPNSPNPRSGASTPNQNFEAGCANESSSLPVGIRRSSLSPLGEIRNTPTNENLFSDGVRPGDGRHVLDSRNGSAHTTSDVREQHIQIVMRTESPPTLAKHENAAGTRNVEVTGNASGIFGSFSILEGEKECAVENGTRRDPEGQPDPNLKNSTSESLEINRSTTAKASRGRSRDVLLPTAEQDPKKIVEPSRAARPEEPHTFSVCQRNTSKHIDPDPPTSLKTFTRIRKKSQGRNASPMKRMGAFPTSDKEIQGFQSSTQPREPTGDRLQAERLENDSATRHVASRTNRAMSHNFHTSSEVPLDDTILKSRKRSNADSGRSLSRGSALKRQKTSSSVITMGQMPSPALTLRNLASVPDLANAAGSASDGVGRELLFGSNVENSLPPILDRLMRIEESSTSRKYLPFRDTIRDRMRQNMTPKSTSYTPVSMFSMGSVQRTTKIMSKLRTQKRARLRTFHARRLGNTDRIEADSLRETMSMAKTVGRWQTSSGPFGQLSTDEAECTPSLQGQLEGQKLNLFPGSIPSTKRRKR